MNPSVSHDRYEEASKEKARWFQSLPVEKRIELLCAFTDLILAVNPHIVQQKGGQPIEGHVRILEAP